MGWIRHHVAHVAGAWLVFQLCLLAAVPAVLCSPESTVSFEPACTCTHGDGDGQSCPMHHPSASSSNCSCRSTTDSRAAIVASLIGPTAVLAPTSSTVAPSSALSAARSFSAEPLESATPPDSPPPRV